MSRPRRYAVVPAVLLGALAAQTGLAAPAHAASVRYASPTGSGTSCSATSPCTIITAVNSAGSGDVVVVNPGTYAISAPLSRNVSNLTVRGSAVSPRPVIVSSADTALSLGGSGAKVTDLTIQHQGGTWGLNVLANGVGIERVEVRSPGVAACSIGYAGLVRDSLCVSTGAGGTALSDMWGADTGLLVLRNVTAVATGAASYGLRAESDGNNTRLIVNARNVIAQGTAADVRVNENGDNSEADVLLANSNYDTVQLANFGFATTAGSGTNQKTQPVYTDATNFRQAATSPTVNAGAADSFVGGYDIDGQPRVVGPAPDIGADEFVPDTTAPDVVLTKKAKKKTTKRKTKFSFAATEPATFTCKVDKKKAKPCVSPYKAKAKRLGKHRLTVTATDGSGNVDPTPLVVTWKVKAERK